MPKHTLAAAEQNLARWQSRAGDPDFHQPVVAARIRYWTRQVQALRAFALV